jgi:hypothetical protein
LYPSVYLPIYFVVSPLAFLLQNRFLVPSSGCDVVPTDPVYFVKFRS